MPTDFLWYLDMFNRYGWMVGVLLLERLFPIRRETPLVSRGWVYDLIHMHEPFLRALIVGGAVAILLPLMQKHVPGAGLLVNQSLWISIIAMVVVNEAATYWGHRLLHRLPWLWEFHRVHHSSTTYYSLIATRFHVVDVLIALGPALVLANWLGIRPDVQIGYSLFLGFMDRYVHSNVRGPRFTGYIFNTPYFHSWHHSTDPEAHDKNFSRVFVFMDYLFGTAYYPKDKVAREFGDPQFPVNYFVQQALPFWSVGKMIARKFAPATPQTPTPSIVEKELSEPRAR
ncbi:MAG TPA: sterol desaturase family protein [Ramlibacter sp.]|nr:sterol desaturase family protein [Ramlibacter sp.]